MKEKTTEKLNNGKFDLFNFSTLKSIFSKTNKIDKSQIKPIKLKEKVRNKQYYE